MVGRRLEDTLWLSYPELEEGTRNASQARKVQGQAPAQSFGAMEDGKTVMTPIISVVGTSGSGKTTLLEKLIPELKSRGYRLAVVKHDAHSFEIDHEGKDSWRLKAAGADVVVISSPAKIAMIEDTHKDHTLEEISRRIADRVDIIISEGFKRGPHPKIEVFRAAHGRELLCTSQDNILAIASDVPLKAEVPCVHIDDVKSLADLIERRFLGNKEDMR